MRLENRLALVTGGARGIGKNICMQFLGEGASVIIFDIDQEEGKKTEDEFNREYGDKKAAFFTVDITDEEQVEKTVARIIEEREKIDILVNNAGITMDSLILRMDVDDWRKVIDINLTGSFICSKFVIRHMVKARSGNIINISSIVGVHGNIGQANYSASKAGLIGLTKTLARELAGRNIRVNAVAPGYISTEMTEKIPDKIKDRVLEKIPAGELGTVEDVARAVLFLAAPDSRYITGIVLGVDGGMGI